MSRELALRIGLASRALPDTDAKGLFNILVESLGFPLTEEKIAGITTSTLKVAHAGVLSDIDESLLIHALEILKTDSKTGNPIIPVVHHYHDGDLPNSIRIAFASNDYYNVDGHFGNCKQFLIYQLSATAAYLIDIREPDHDNNPEIEDKNTYRAELISDCQVLYVASVGGPAAAKIVRLGIHPLKLSNVEKISAIISQLQSVISTTPPPWLAKVMGIEAAERFRFERETTA
ncbi:MAG: nitrogen fixation protein NifX [Methylococcales bacterium]|nr:nitrogen fixation protein NifX [Methylococcales bacterium]